MPNLNLPDCDFRRKQEKGRTLILDPFRRKYVVLTPEEEVRQRLAHYLISEKGFPATLIQTEETLRLNEMVRRCDILVHKPAGNPVLLGECKAPTVRISQAAFDQAARYNLVFNVPYLLISNGLKHYCCRVDFRTRRIDFMDHLPAYADI